MFCYLLEKRINARILFLMTTYRRVLNKTIIYCILVDRQLNYDKLSAGKHPQPIQTPQNSQPHFSYSDLVVENCSFDIVD